jgi:hypothetical protein
MRHRYCHKAPKGECYETYYPTQAALLTRTHNYPLIYAKKIVAIRVPQHNTYITIRSGESVPANCERGRHGGPMRASHSPTWPVCAWVRPQVGPRCNVSGPPTPPRVSTSSGHHKGNLSLSLCSSVIMLITLLCSIHPPLEKRSTQVYCRQADPLVPSSAPPQAAPVVSPFRPALVIFLAWKD